MTRIVHTRLSREELLRLAGASFGDFVKAVVDIRLRRMAIGGELHADQEALLLQEGSSGRNLRGVNIYPGLPADAMVEFDSVITIRPSQQNRSLLPE